MKGLTADHITAWVNQHFESKRSGKQLRICNPDGQDDGYHLWISLTKTPSKNGRVDFWVHDFRPNHQTYDGSFLHFVAKYRKISYRQAVKEVCGDAVDLRSLLAREEKVEIEEPTRNLIELPSGAVPIEDPTDPFQALALSYLHSRGFDVQAARRYRLQCTVDSIIFPYYEFDDLVYWQSRSLLGKTFNFPSGTTKSDYLFGYDFCEPGDVMGIVESAYNAMALGENVVASGGASLNDNSLRKIRLLKPSKIVLAPDNDEAGKKSLRANYFLLKPLAAELYVSLPPPNVDWAEILEKEGAEAARHCYECNQRKLTIAEVCRLTL